MNPLSIHAKGCGAEMGERLIQLLKDLHSVSREDKLEAVADVLCILTLYKGEYAQSVADGFAEAVLDVLTLGVASPQHGAVQ